MMLITVQTEFRNSSGAEQPKPASVDIGHQIRGLVEADWIEADRQFATLRSGELGSSKVNARGVTTTMDAAGGCDGIKTGRFGFHLAVGENDPWWQVDLGGDYRFDRIVVYNRTDGGLAPRTRKISIHVARDGQPDQFEKVYQHDGTPFFGVTKNKPLVVSFKNKNVTGRIVRVFVAGTCHLALDEVEVYGAEEPGRNIALNKPADQKSVSRHSVPGTAEMGSTTASADGGFLLAHTQEVVKRGRELVARLKAEAEPARLDPAARELEQLGRRLAELKQGDDVPDTVRKEVYLDARRIVRNIAFANPLLDFDKLLFIKRRHPNYQHMCDQYYGFTSVAGGGLFVLSDVFSDHPKLTNLLASSKVENGRFQDRELVPGSFLSPELSYDGTTILFAYTENASPERSAAQAEKDRAWKTNNCYHLFKVRADGSYLVQLTDGPWNDFDPCFLPAGRIAFISERRGGYVRCGTRACRSYNLCSIEADGSDMLVLSHHDTNEWHPSVDNDGMLVYTRWDYIDRDTQAAHHFWTCYPDGRDPRAPHGNYPKRLADRPWAELDIRAIPGSRKYIAVAAPHHGHAFGSLIQIDLGIADDNANSQVTRLTPEVPFPEAEAAIRPSLVYGTPWPLSEDDYLCVYDRGATNHGIYWVDRFGNKELIYRDTEIPCFSPIPLRPRATPPAVPNPTTEPAATENAAGKKRPATVAVTDVYDSDFAWPENTRITALRVLQILPKSTPRRNVPKIGVAEQSNARAVLGTVPVEADGSAFFEVPAGKAIYFQTLNERGMAIHSMRSATYAHPGERLTCQGCHEPRHRAPNVSAELPLAVQRPPSKIQPDLEGSNPFNYVRLVQPVLDRNCVDCHRLRNAIDLSGTIEHVRDRDGRDWPFTRSYNNLAKEYGFWFQTLINSLNAGGHHGGSRVVPGKFGARASKLLEYLDERHYGVKLSQKDFHRVTLWLDCNSEFLGAYEDPQAQARGQLVKPSLE
ncbi:MAG: hypothetical protein GY878_19850 [Fuerstiella sp.]|nr:hypothetical protein [Fuerstiella sp.]